jgi:excinuclease ABC subunit A
LYTRIGKTISPISGKEVKKDTVTDVINFIKKFKEGEKLLLLAPIILEKGRTLENKLLALLQQGYARIKYDDCIVRLDDLKGKKLPKEVYLVIDRVITKNDEDFINRLADAVEIAFFEGKGELYIENISNSSLTIFNNRFEADGISFLSPNIHLFSFNNPYGACKACEGYGDVIGIDSDLVVPNTALSVFENAIFPWRGESMSWYRDQLVNAAYKFDFPIHKPWFELSESQKLLVWEGNDHFRGLNDFFEELTSKSYKIQNRVMLSRYRGKTICNTCKGKRLRKEAAYVKINGTSLQELVELPLDKVTNFFKRLQLNKYDKKIAKRLLIEINNRLEFLNKVGLNYLTLNRKSNTLSGGESQRINLATSLGSSLVGSMYILDEPSIGLHPKDTERLIEVLKSLRDLGNTVIVVEHDEDIMKAADEIIDIGPEAGSFGGEVVATGSFKKLLKSNSLTAQYLNGTLSIKIPAERRTSKNSIQLIGARHHNLKNIDVQFPLGCFTAISGVSGSGKSTLVKKILYPAFLKEVVGYGEKPGQFSKLEGNFSSIKNVEFVNQNPIGRSSRLIQ